MIALYGRWLDAYPIVSIEDGLDENDWEGFAAQTASRAAASRSSATTFSSQPGLHRPRHRPEVRQRGADQTQSDRHRQETIQAIELCREAGWGYVISHRSGETEDTFMADFAVAMGGGQIKTGSACRSERIAKYNRLIEIERELGRTAQFRSPFASAGLLLNRRRACSDTKLRAVPVIARQPLVTSR